LPGFGGLRRFPVCFEQRCFVSCGFECCSERVGGFAKRRGIERCSIQRCSEHRGFERCCLAERRSIQRGGLSECRSSERISAGVECSIVCGCLHR